MKSICVDLGHLTAADHLARHGADGRTIQFVRERDTRAVYMHAGQAAMTPVVDGACDRNDSIRGILCSDHARSVLQNGDDLSQEKRALVCEFMGATDEAERVPSGDPWVRRSLSDVVDDAAYNLRPGAVRDTVKPILQANTSFGRATSRSR